MNPAHLKKRTWWLFFLWLGKLLAKKQKLLDILTYRSPRVALQRRFGRSECPTPSFHGKGKKKHSIYEKAKKETTVTDTVSAESF